MFPNNELFPSIVQGQEYLAESIKLLVYQTEPALFERLDFNNDGIFLEPFLFAYFNSKSPQIKLKQILFGYLDKDQRPDRLEVFAEENGVIYLPNIGYLITELKDKNVQLSYDSISDNFEVWSDKKKVDFKFEEILKVPGTDIEIYKYFSTFFKPYFAEWNDTKKDFENFGTEVEIAKTTKLQFGKLVKAVEILKRHCPEQFEQYNLTTRRIVIFHNPKIRNFAVRDIHGTAFLSARPEHSEIFFIEEIVHQCSHNVFNAITSDLKEHFKIDPETALIKYSQRQGEFRSIYSAHHGLYTVATRLYCFDACIDILEGELLHEAVGRFSDLRKRFRNGLDKMKYDEVFTDRGYEVYRLLDEYCALAFSKRNYLVNRFNYSNQGAGFSYEKFAALNSIEYLADILLRGKNEVMESSKP